MGMRRNRLRELLRRDEPTLGTHVHSTWPGIIEVIGHTKLFDYVEFVSTYAPYDLYALDDMARAAEVVDLSLMIKVDIEPKLYLAQRAISSGFQAILFTNIFNAEDAEECVRAVKTEPRGIDGFGLWRIVGHTMTMHGEKITIEEFMNYINDIVIVIMIERKSAMENLEEILSIKGIDMVQFGPADYLISIGRPGARSEAREAELKMIKTALDMGVRPRVECDVKDVKRYIELGVKDFCIGRDVSIIFNWCKRAGEEVRNLLERR